jgi:site-specific DNA-methyltransferase (adenine-specific)
VVDPPYGIGASSKSFINGTSKTKKDYYKDSCWDKAIPTHEYFSELMRVSKNWIVWGGNYFTQYLPPARCFIVWDKKTGANSYADCELALTNIDSNARIITKFWLGAHAQDDDGRIHPTQKPIMVYDFIYQNYAKEGYKILDTHLGSGSSRIAAYKAKLDFVGFELDKEYYDTQEKRFNQFKSQLTLF